MRLQKIVLLSLSMVSTPVLAQHIEKIDASKAPTVYRPDDLFNLAPNQWHYAEHLWQGSNPCVLEQCEAGYTSGDLVLSVEHSKGWVRVMAGFRNCAPVAFSEIETSKSPDRYLRSKVERQVGQVVKGAAKSCKVTAPSVANISVASMFPGRKGN
ncbi:MAG TPA: hypothetical protein VFU91_01910 [Sphingomicrobium sp.]|nr:hypothetical protein [Sphingomicrobium sp.]